MLDRRVCPCQKGLRVGFLESLRVRNIQRRRRKKGQSTGGGRGCGGRQEEHTPRAGSSRGPTSHLPCLQEEGLTHFQGNLSAASKLPFLCDWALNCPAAPMGLR